MGSEVVSGAAQGASAGAVAGPWGALIGAGVGAIGGYLGGKKAKRKQKEEKQRQARIRALGTPQHLAEVVASLQPMMREIVASGMGPQFQEAVATSLASHGLTGTGTGEALRAGAQGAPGIFATQMATSQGQDVVRNQLAAEGIAGDVPDQPGNPFLDAMLGGARGYLSGGGTFGTNRASAAPTAPESAPAAFRGSTMADYTSLPNLTPQPRSTLVGPPS